MNSQATHREPAGAGATVAAWRDETAANRPTWEQATAARECGAAEEDGERWDGMS